MLASTGGDAMSRRAHGDRGRGSRLLILLDACYVASVLYICALALHPALSRGAPSWIRWFGEPGSHATIAVVLAFPLLHFALRRLAGKRALTGPPLVVIAAMAASALALGMSAYWRCSGSQAPFFAPLSWTLALFAGNVEAPFGPGGPAACATMPIALEIGRLLAIATTLTAAVAAALALFQSQLDRIAIWRAASLTVVVGIDDETVSMVRAIARTTNPNGTLVVLTDSAESALARTVHDLGARVRAVNLAEPESMSTLTLWNRLNRLYLLSADPVENLKRFRIIDAKIGKARGAGVRLPLTIRIDDPWQAEVWRRSFLANSQHGWVADAVGRNEITAAKLVRHMTRRDGAAGDLNPPTSVVLCGLHPLTYALASEFAQLRREQRLYPNPDVHQPGNVTIFASGAQSFVDDHHLRQGRMAPEGAMVPVGACDQEPTVEAITRYLRNEDPNCHAVVLADSSMETLGTRLASRFPELRVYSASAASTSLAFTNVGHLYSFPINMDLDADAPQDVWERAAELIHEHYSSGTQRDTPATRPWSELDPFLKQSNRRQLLNALSMAETIAGRTWNSLAQAGQAEPLPEAFAAMEPLEQLRILGFDEPTVAKMVEAEHEDWRKYYEDAGWKYAERRDDRHRRHNKLLPWSVLVDRHPEFVRAARRSLVSTLVNLRDLGYRSVPKAVPADEGWRHYRRHGEVTAEQRSQGWTWRAPTGDVMNAQAGDWAVTDESGDERSVAAEVFPSTHRQVGPGRYQRSGTVLARQATEREVIETLEGDAVANEGDWILKGPQGEQWPVPDRQFRDSYEGPVDDHATDR